MPSRIGRYVVRRRIGSGGFATVWLAYDEQLDSPVAVKVLAENWTEDHHVRQRFLEEGRFLRKVESPHVVSVYDAGELDDGRPYLVMSYADQGTLADRLEIDGLSTAQGLEVVRQVGAGLTALHERGVLHRDVKPANVLFRTVESRTGDPQVRAMLADLGLGKALDMSSRLTMIAGTPSFVAPEQAQGESLDPRADLYALAALTHLLLSGSAPFRYSSLKEAADPGPAPDLNDGPRRYPAVVADVVRRGLAADRDDRWPDVTAFVDALGRSLGPTLATELGTDGEALPGPWLPVDPQLTQPGPRPSSFSPGGSLPDPAPPPKPPPSRRRRLLVAAAAVFALVAGAVAGAVLQQEQDLDVVVRDSTGALEVTVPESWSAAVDTGQWSPPDQDATLPALSAGTSGDWESTDAGQGVFLGILDVDDMPEELPGHPGCDATLDPVTDVVGDDAVLTQVSTGCPGVVVERVRQVATNRYLWVQVRSAERSLAYDVLEGVSAPGF
ncbi:hypothetical protein GCM10009623_16210 [Nocardioides aestuarii]|uniref:non-specific serine/threonine protein kinase n=1 Tax=Nocardioides aestuarii TaxID=252231 RepID=A0ABW4TKE2_9ACTN